MRDRFPFALPLLLLPACGGGGGGSTGPDDPENGLGDTPPSAARTVEDPTLTIRLLRLDAETGGGGDAVLVADSSGSRPLHLLLDAGDDRTAADYLNQAGIDTLDLLVLTHAHFDHFGGMDEVLDGVHVKAFAFNGQIRSRADYEALVTELRARADTVFAVTDLVTWWEDSAGGMEVTLLPPYAAFLALDTEGGSELNEGSLGIRVRQGSFTFLSTGDAEFAANQRFSSQFPALVDVEVLKVGHHGSADATQDFWLDATTPQVAVISANGVTHPHGVTLDLLRRKVPELFCTPQHGVVTFQVTLDGAYAVSTSGDPRVKCRVGSEAF
jgi:beta-lactamase superfamily II metal-dependent hydrolase